MPSIAFFGFCYVQVVGTIIIMSDEREDDYRLNDYDLVAI